MAFSQSIGIDMPPDFPTVAHDAVGAGMAPHQQRLPQIWREFGGGWNAVIRRFKTAADADDLFTTSIQQSDSPSLPERQAQEEALFVFFVAGYSVMESFAYSLFALGAMLRPTDFPMSTPVHLRAIRPSIVAQRFGTFFSGQPVARSLDALLSDPVYTDWGDIRNVLAHRSAPPRQFGISANLGGTSASVVQSPTTWQVPGGMIINDCTTHDKRLWLVQRMTECVEATGMFVTANFP